MVFDLCRAIFHSVTIESDCPGGGLLTWDKQGPLPFYHHHQPGLSQMSVCAVRLQLPDSGEPLDLTPLLSVQRCGVCDQWAVFHLDRYESSKQRAWFFDFVKGHSYDRRDLTMLGQWMERIRSEDAAGAVPPSDPTERREPDPQRFVDFAAEFEAPAYLARQVADFIGKQDRGVIMLTGPGGVGKTWASFSLDHGSMLPAELRRAVAVLKVSLHGPQPLTAGDVQAALMDQAKRRRDPWQVPHEPDAPTPYARFAGWLAALMRANPTCRDLLLVVLDGLDDLPADSDVPVLLPPANELPRGCYLVLSRRPAVQAAAEVGLQRVVRAEVMFHRSQQARCFIAGRLDHLTAQTRKRLLHERMPRILIAALGRLLQEDGVALGVHRHRAKPSGKAFIIDQGDGFGGHVPCHPRAFLAAVSPDRLLHLPVDLLLSAIGRADKPIKAREFQEQAHQANATRTHFRTHQVYPEHQTMQEGQPWGPVEKGHDGGMFVKTFLIRPPCLQRAAGHIKRLGGLTQGEPLGLPIAILIEAFRASGAIPSWGTIIMASWCGWDDGSHRDLLV